MKEPTEELIDAIEDMIDDMEYQRNPPGTWTGFEYRLQVRARLAKALTEWLEKSRNG